MQISYEDLRDFTHVQKKHRAEEKHRTSVLTFVKGKLELDKGVRNTSRDC